MKRSQINTIIRQSEAFMRDFGYILPPFAGWSPEEMVARKAEIAGITGAGLGWDITDFGLGDFASKGLFLFTTRNGRVGDLKRGRGMLYAEKAMISRKDQVTPMHRHDLKAEDIINRGGGTLVIELFGDTDGHCDREKGVTVATDGVVQTFEPGHRLRLAPGESVTLMPGDWHAFWAEEADVFVAEVSTVNDDAIDNIFEDPLVSRFSGIEEDEHPVHLLVSDYGTWLR
ncbi:D-lyxose/D-mannose family sugar isomerase [Pararhizobium antarcticum]|uniref:D-lyxose ketol-isomerase n=1 Tax=Pararhizobium antarcticum TaxID=1798805 RepID=A0A657LN02_9HYPH|nr:D-lyxose/D-mannose family sugar isomerase [Pararhizobium antarcticum]OJF91357.1 sugar ABC transporter [Pararhizobium antarcticum]OJG01335.1 sugar ABC transporter [Rhizobium sp. 58]